VPLKRLKRTAAQQANSARELLLSPSPEHGEEVEEEEEGTGDPACDPDFDVTTPVGIVKGPAEAQADTAYDTAMVATGKLENPASGSAVSGAPQEKRQRMSRWHQQTAETLAKGKAKAASEKAEGLKDMAKIQVDGQEKVAQALADSAKQVQEAKAALQREAWKHEKDIEEARHKAAERIADANNRKEMLLAIVGTGKSFADAKAELELTMGPAYR
jgi:hypothetical protein